MSVRLGLKGPRAAELLATLGIPVPAQPNTWAPLEDAGAPGIVARLGGTEFFIECDATGDRLRALDAQLAAGAAGAYPVLHEDFSVVLGGSAAEDVLAQVCNVNFGALDLAARPVVMTSMIGVGVLVLPQAADDGVSYRIWCDPSYGSYLQSALDAVSPGTTRKTA